MPDGAKLAGHGIPIAVVSILIVASLSVSQSDPCPDIGTPEGVLGAQQSVDRRP